MTIDSYVTLGNERETVYSADDLVRDLDRAEVDMAVAAPADREIAVLNRKGNDGILKEAAKHPDRIIPSCTVNPWYGNDAVDELIRAAELGARMLILHPTIQGFLINDGLADRVIAKAGENRMPVYVHTGGHLYGAPWQLVDCALRFPECSFIMGHAGATDFWNDVPHACSAARNVSIEGSFARPFSFMNHLNAVGVEKGIMGSSAPRNSLVFEWEQYRECLPPETYGPIYGDTLAKLLGLDADRVGTV